jgi:hypothetical protein
MRVIFVRRGEFSTYDVLSDSVVGVNDVDVRWDRRHSDDRRAKPRPIDVTAERRRGDRRKPPTRDWQLHGYTVVDLPDAELPPSTE